MHHLWDIYYKYINSRNNNLGQTAQPNYRFYFILYTTVDRELPVIHLRHFGNMPEQNGIALGAVAQEGSPTSTSLTKCRTIKSVRRT
jgi:hypothetical protein